MTQPLIRMMMLYAWMLVLCAHHGWSSTSNVTPPAVILYAGETLEIPLQSEGPIAPDLNAQGLFQKRDVVFTPSPTCHLAAEGCTLLITVSPKSLPYHQVPVIVSQSNASNAPMFYLSVIPQEHTKPASSFVPVLKFKHTPSPQHTSNITSIQQVEQDVSHRARSWTTSSGNLVAAILNHSLPTLDYTNTSNGPVYQMIQITNNGASAVTLAAPSITGGGLSSFSIDTTSSHYAGSPILCSNAPTLSQGESCKLIIQSTVGDPNATPTTAILTISDDVSADTLTFTLTDTTYVYAGGAFNALGNAQVSGGALLAQCTQGTCSNALQGTSGNNYAYTFSSVGSWINALSVTSSGTLIVGGVFGGIGGATSGATTGTAALLAQCIPGSNVSSNACLNQLSNTNNYATNNAYINGITFFGPNALIFGGDFKNIRTLTSDGRLLTRSLYSGVTAGANLVSYLGTTKYANNAIVGLSTLNGVVAVGGLFTQIAGYPSSAPSSGTSFATCTTSACSQAMTNNPNGSILGMTNDGTYLYMGGTFTNIGGYTDTNGGYPLVACTPGSSTTCVNALSGTLDANGYLEGLTYANSTLFVGGKFSTIGGATPVNSGNMLAQCTPSGTCSNFVTDTQNYATGSNWGGGIFAIAVGNQTTITPN